MQTAVIVTNEARIISKARKGLEMVHAGEEKTMEGWLLYGAALNEGREMFPRGGKGDKDFGAWKLENLWSSNLDNHPHCADEQAAMWAAANPEEFLATKKANPRVRTVRGLHAKFKNPEPVKVEPATPPEKEMLRKLKVLAEQGATEGERAAAQRKLDRYTSEFRIDPASIETPGSSVGLTRRDLKFKIAETLIANADKKLALNYIMFFVDMAFESNEDLERQLNEIKEKF